MELNKMKKIQSRLPDDYEEIEDHKNNRYENLIRQFDDITINYYKLRDGVTGMVLDETYSIANLNSTWVVKSDFKLPRSFKTFDDNQYYQLDDYTVKKYSYFPYSRIIKSNNTYHIATDSLTNSTLISYLISVVYEQNQIPMKGYNLIYTNYIYKHSNLITNQSTGYQLSNALDYNLIDYINDMEKDMIEVYNQTSTDIVPVIPKTAFLDILKQISSNLIYLKIKNDFRGNRVIADLIGVSEEPIKYNYQKIKVNSSYTFFISDFDYSEIKIESSNYKYHLYQSAELTQKLTFSFKDGYYRLNSWSALEYGQPKVKYNMKKHPSAPLEWDMVTFIISLLLIPEVYYLVISDTELSDAMLNQIFHQEDIAYLITKIKNNMNKKTSYAFVINILKDIRFKQSFGLQVTT